MHVNTGVKLSMILALAITLSKDATAANWLMLQGIQPDTVAPKGVIVPYRSKVPKVWGFVQATYREDLSTVAQSGGKTTTPFALLNPDVKDQSGFNVFRARLAARGMADDDNMVNYFVMTEFGNNGVTAPAGHKDVGTYITDASVTLKYIPGAKIRAGMFKTPSSEEGLQAVYVSPYIDFTTMTDQQLLERKVSRVGAKDAAAAAGGAATAHYTGTASASVGAFRDTGVQIFDTFDVAKDWTFSYAYMMGNGNGVALDSSDKQRTHYGYLALEENFGAGKGYFTEAMKFYVWGMKGTRTLLSGTSPTITPLEFDRNRYGLGMSYYHNGIRFEAEYMRAEGMIYTGAKDTDADPSITNWDFQFAADKSNKADGGLVNLQYEIVPKKFEVFGRYDWMDRLTNDVKGQRDFTTTTLGCSYRFKGATRLDFNYAIRDARAPGNTNAQKVLDNMGDRYGVMLTAEF